MRRFIREYRIYWSGCLFFTGLFILCLGFIWYLALYSIGWLESLGSWNYWLLIFSSLLVVLGGWYFVEYLLKKRKFNKLIKTSSKAKFIRSLNEFEELVYALPKKYRAQLEDKKRRFRAR